MARPLSFRWDEGFVARIDAARGDVSRSLWVRRCVERALSDPTFQARPPVAPQTLAGVTPDFSGLDKAESAAPAEQSRSELFRRATQR